MPCNPTPENSTTAFIHIVYIGNAMSNYVVMPPSSDWRNAQYVTTKLLKYSTKKEFIIKSNDVVGLIIPYA